MPVAPIQNENIYFCEPISEFCKYFSVTRKDSSLFELSGKYGPCTTEMYIFGAHAVVIFEGCML